MGSLEVPYHQMTGISFALYTADEIRQLSVKEITNPVSLDVLLHATYGGLYDLALGATDEGEVCKTCGQNYIHCPGHMGHISLPMPVFNPVLFQTMVKLLKGTCFRCRRLMAGKGKLHTFQAKLRALDYGLISLVNDLQDKYNEVCGEDGVRAIKDNEAIQLVDECLHDAIKGKDEKTSLYSSNVKNVVEYRQALCKSFINGTLWSNKCPHCFFPSRPIRTEHNTKVFFFKGLNKDLINKFFTQKMRVAQAKKKKRQREDEGDIDEMLVEQDELEEEKFDPAALEKELLEIENQQYLTPTEVRRHLRKVWEKDGDVLGQVFKSLAVQVPTERHPTDVFFITVLPVPPSRFRPRASLGDMKFDNPQTATYTKILEGIIQMKDILRDMSKAPESLDKTIDITDGDTTEKTDADKAKEAAKDFTNLNNAWLRLQRNVNCVIDMDLDKVNKDRQPGIKQLIEKKEGLFRMNMMGKRVNYACRSVISPDPYINTNEIGVPKVFASKLTYPQPVTPWNFQELKQAVINGPDIYPGAAFIEMEDGHRIMLHANKPENREAIAKQLLTPSSDGKLGSKKVYRHLKNGDVMLLNRQPTLHRPSIQAHKARVLGDEKTLRLHYANCKAYNADFDGDEMNAHFPQDEISRAEAYTIAATDYQYLVPKDGTPLAGLIQDHMVSGVTLTLRGQFFCRADYHQLVYGALTDKGGRIKTLKPSIRKPQVLWSGKQVLSTVLINIIPEGKTPLNLSGSAKVSPKDWITKPPRPWAVGQPLTGNNMSESEVVILQGELLVGVLDKGHYGPTAYGLVHSCYELYGGPVAGRLLTCLAKLFTCFLQIHGFTLGVKDILCLPKADKERRKIMVESTKCGPAAAAHAFNVEDASDEEALKKKYEEAHYSKEGELKDLDLAMKGKTDEHQNKIAKAIIPNGLLKHFPQNNLQLMVQSGAKGSSVNCMQISCLLGQIELEGRRPPLMLNGKSLPSFPAYDMRPWASGFITGRFLTGIRPQDYYFHCMAGREGLVDTAVKTSRSGYLQRCIIKHLEGLVVNYDQTVRDSDGSIVQFQYGEDGLDICKTPFLQRKLLPFLIDNQNQLVTLTEEANIAKHTDTDTAPQLWKKLSKWKKKHGDPLAGRQPTPFLRFCDKKWASVVAEYPHADLRCGRQEAAYSICDMWRQLDEAKKSKYQKLGQKAPDPLLSKVQSSRYIGVVSENYQHFVDNYIDTNPDKLLKYNGEHCRRWEISADRLRNLLYVRNLKAQVPPGEAVGLLAAQSIGEPSTQMTLNTFHFAGRGEMNVTLGIPRLREILMVASAAIKTPNMDVPVLPGRTALKKAKLLKKKFTKVYLSQVLEDLEVTERLCVKHNKSSTGGRSRMYTLHFRFLPHEMYKDDLYLTPSKVLQYMERRFLMDLEYALRKKREDLSKTSLLKSGTLKDRDWKTAAAGDTQQKDEDENDVEEDDFHDGDATATKQRERQMQEGRDYQGEEEEKALVEEDDEAVEDQENELILEREEAELGEKEEEEDDSQNATMMDTTITESTKTKKRRKSKAQMSEARVNHVLGKVAGAVSYMYDADEELWCEVTLNMPLSSHKLDMTSMVDAAARRAVVHETKGITRCFLSESKGDGQPARLKMEGINLQELQRYQDCLDLNNLYTNDIHATAKTYGVEAAARSIIKEVRDVFAAYGIGVNYRHLSLVADYMTFEGEYKAFNRMGINSNPSPFQKMSFETTMAFLKSAIISGAYDDLKSPSSRIIVGRTVKGGTGCFDLLQPI